MTYVDLKSQRPLPCSAEQSTLSSDTTPNLDFQLLQRFRAAVAALKNNNPRPLEDLKQDPQMARACGEDLLPTTTPPIPNIGTVLHTKK